MEKYAVRCGGGHNHRTGLFDAVLIKDNHLAHVVDAGQRSLTPGGAVARARQRLREMLPSDAEAMIVEVEVDSLEQLQQVLPQQPDIVLLDNMSLDELREAVARRDAAGLTTELEASGGVTLETVASIARTGVERISVGVAHARGHLAGRRLGLAIGHVKAWSWLAAAVSRSSVVAGQLSEPPQSAGPVQSLYLPAPCSLLSPTKKPRHSQQTALSCQPGQSVAREDFLSPGWSRQNS